VNFLAKCMLEFSLCSLKIVRGTWGKVACFSAPVCWLQANRLLVYLLSLVDQDGTSPELRPGNSSLYNKKSKQYRTGHYTE
jgi:hypothetical protein